jgi:hypothetical protein
MYDAMHGMVSFQDTNPINVNLLSAYVYAYKVHNEKTSFQSQSFHVLSNKFGKVELFGNQVHGNKSP